MGALLAGLFIFNVLFRGHDDRPSDADALLINQRLSAHSRRQRFHLNKRCLGPTALKISR